MKRLLITTIVSTCIFSNLYAGGARTTQTPPAEQTPNGTKKPVNPNVKNPTDQTDTYAIPLDSSEMEEQEEERELLKEQKKYQNSNVQPYRNNNQNNKPYRGS